MGESIKRPIPQYVIDMEKIADSLKEQYEALEKENKLRIQPVKDEFIHIVKSLRSLSIRPNTIKYKPLFNKLTKKRTRQKKNAEIPPQ